MIALSRTDFPTAVTKALKILKNGESYTQNKLAQKTDLNARTIQKVLSLLGEVQSVLKEKEIDISELDNVKIIRMKEKGGLASLPDSLQKMIIKTLYYPTTSREEEVLAHLLIKNAISKKSAISLPEGKILRELENAEQIVKTGNGKYYLTDIGLMVAKGATELYPELKNIQ
jgi:predicted transcriptional regulator